MSEENVSKEDTVILLSNHLLNLEQFTELKDVVIRVNMAHVRDYEELTKFVNVDYDIFLDYPCTRTKPPVPTVNVRDALRAIREYPSIKYFAVSNIETPEEVDIWVGILPEGVDFVPKIETRRGVENLQSICQGIQYAMLDSEDLYTDVGGDAALYLKLKDRAKRDCESNNVTLLELYGVVFA